MEEQWKEGHKRHFGTEGIYNRLKSLGYNWTKREVQKRINQCKDCAKFRRRKPVDEFGGLEEAQRPREVISMDYIGPLNTMRNG